MILSIYPPVWAWNVAIRLDIFLIYPALAFCNGLLVFFVDIYVCRGPAIRGCHAVILYIATNILSFRHALGLVDLYN